MFTLIHDDPPKQTYCDQTQHIHVVLPANAHSGFPLGLSLGLCDCQVVMPEDATEATPDLTNAATEGEDVPPASPEAFEKL